MSRPLFALGFALLIACSPTARALQPGKLDGKLAVETFDAAWRLVDESPYAVRARGIDWDAVARRHRPAAARARNMAELRQSIQAMLDEIGESHFNLIPADAVDITHSGKPEPVLSGFRDSGLVAGMVEGKLAVLQVAPGSPAATQGIQPGWRIERINGRTMATALAEIEKLEPKARRTAQMYFESAIASLLETSHQARKLKLELRDAQNRTQIREVVPAPATGELVNIPLLPPALFHIYQQRLALADGGCIGLIRFNLWAPALSHAFPKALAEVRDCQAIAIDLRGNPGGVMGTAMGVGGYLVSQPTPLGYFSAGGSSARLPALPRRVTDDGKPLTPYSGKLAILLDGRSASTSEVFASGLQQAGRATIIGTPSAGMALPSLMNTLPNGDRLLYAVADLTAPNGQRLEGIGITPDIFAPNTFETLHAGEDATLRALQQWLQADTFPTQENP
ncbi:MAG: S41 family peptidase [Pseudomonadota bacterium]|nr:S41 family peptidase [Pseudomonadota bacterium]